MKLKTLPILLALLVTPAAAQTPAELDAYYTAKAAEQAANQIVVRANAAAITAITAGITDIETRIAALEAKVGADNAAILQTLKTLQAQPGVTTQQVIDALIARLSRP